MGTVLALPMAWTLARLGSTAWSRINAITLVNASVSGEATGGGLTRLPEALAVHNPNLVILELGGNDGLRALIDRIQNNLIAMVQAIRASGSEVALGWSAACRQRYLTKFIGMYAAIAESGHSYFYLPCSMDWIPRDLLQRDGIHPTADAQPLIKAQIHAHYPWISGD